MLAPGNRSTIVLGGPLIFIYSRAQYFPRVRGCRVSVENTRQRFGERVYVECGLLAVTLGVVFAECTW